MHDTCLVGLLKSGPMAHLQRGTEIGVWHMHASLDTCDLNYCWPLQFFGSSSPFGGGGGGMDDAFSSFFGGMGGEDNLH
jgi:hypothetical protein